MSSLPEQSESLNKRLIDDVEPAFRNSSESQQGDNCCKATSFSKETRSISATESRVTDVTIRSQQPSKIQEEDENEIENSLKIVMESTIYDLPDVSQVSKGVLCKLFVASGIALLFLIAEVIGGLLSGSLAILSDAAHMFSDLSGFFISIMSIWVGTRPASKKLSYGYHRAEVIGALGSIVLIWGLTIVLLYEATMRIINKSVVTEPLFMLITAVFGLVCNLCMAKVLHSAPGHSHGHCHGHDHGHSHHEHSHKDEHNHEHKKKDSKKGSKQIKEDSVQEEGNDSSQQQKKGKTTTSHRNSSEIKEEKEHDHEHKHDEHDHDHDHEHKHDHEHDHEHDHDHEHGHDHDHNHDHEEDVPSKKKNLSNIKENDNYNLRAAMIHVIGDVIQSIGVVIAALLIYFYSDPDGSYDYWHLADPICTYLFSILVGFTTVRIVKDCIRVLMEGTPNDIEIKDFREQLLNLEHVVEIHDLHIWSLSVGKPAMSAHIFVNADKNQILSEATKICRQHGIYHSTIQIEDWESKDKPDYIKCKHNIHY